MLVPFSLFYTYSDSHEHPLASIRRLLVLQTDGAESILWESMEIIPFNCLLEVMRFPNSLEHSLRMHNSCFRIRQKFIIRRIAIPKWNEMKWKYPVTIHRCSIDALRIRQLEESKNQTHFVEWWKPHILWHLLLCCHLFIFHLYFIYLCFIRDIHSIACTDKSNYY